jgi:tRNA (uracil-5-)-methyltransferase TRM9
MDLLKINREFYLKTQKYFNISRQSPWDGWEKLLPLLQGRALKCLDLGCGNGRFGKWLSQYKKIDYTGLDNNQYLLDQIPFGHKIKQDITQPWRLKDKFNLIVLMAVLHHIPTKTARLKILQQAKKLLLPGGLLVFTAWNFDQKKIVKKLGPDDFLLYWKKGVEALRYVHQFSDTEIKHLIKNLKLKLIDDFISDDRQGQSNRYLILKKAI